MREHTNERLEAGVKREPASGANTLNIGCIFRIYIRNGLIAKLQVESMGVEKHSSKQSNVDSKCK